MPRPFFALVLAVWLVGGTHVTAQEAPLISCAAVRNLSREEAARHRPVRLSGVVTLVPLDAAGSFTLHDGTGLWVGPPQPAEPAPITVQVGDLVEVEGRTHEGHFAPTVSGDRVRIVGRAPLPVPVSVEPSPASGIHDCQRVTMTGVVQSAESSPRRTGRELRLRIATPTGQCSFLLYDQSNIRPEDLVDSEVTLTGVFLSYFNSRREFLGSRVLTNDPADLVVRRTPPADAFAVAEVPLGNALGFSPQGIDLHRRRVRGTVTLGKPGSYFYLQDGRQALRINTRQADALRPGDRVEAAGFLVLEHHRAEMQEAVFRRLDQGPAPVPLEIGRSQALVREPRATYSPAQDYDDYLVAVRGRLVSIDHKHGEPMRLNLECDGALVPAEFAIAPAGDLAASLRPGSELRVSGVCTVTFSNSLPVVDWPEPVGMRLLLRGAEDVVVIRASPWWTPARLSAALGLTAGVLLVSLTWVVLLRRRVTERSAELAEEMRARRDAAVEFESTLRERNRLAADLHDTTEQALTGLAFQLEATEALQGRSAERSQQHLGLARQLLGRSREDLRRSIWNLRASPLENHTLTEALHEVVADRSAGLAVNITVEGHGKPRALPDFVAGNLLLLAQEGITNALKHASPTQIKLDLKFGEHDLTLTIHDDGTGFDPPAASGPKDGHFGLQGMRERMKRLGGRLELRSRPGEGTTVTATVPA